MGKMHDLGVVWEENILDSMMSIADRCGEMCQKLVIACRAVIAMRSRPAKRAVGDSCVLR